MNKYLLRGFIAIDFIVFYFLLVLVVFYFLLGLAPVLWMAGVFAVLVLLRLVVLQVTKLERTSARCTGQRLSERSATLLGSSLTSMSILTMVAGVYLFIRFGWLTALLYAVLTLIVASTFEGSYEVVETAEASAA